jgi:hypothetical protein
MEEAINAAIEERMNGNANLSQHHYDTALSHGASKSDPRLIDLTHWLSHEAEVKRKVLGDLLKAQGVRRSPSPLPLPFSLCVI